MSRRACVGISGVLVELQELFCTSFWGFGRCPRDSNMSTTDRANAQGRLREKINPHPWARIGDRIHTKGSASKHSEVTRTSAAFSPFNTHILSISPPASHWAYYSSAKGVLPFLWFFHTKNYLSLPKSMIFKGTNLNSFFSASPKMPQSYSWYSGTFE